MEDRMSNKITVERFVEGLSFKTAFLGADKIDVQAFIEDIVAIHHDEIVDLQLAHEESVGQMQQTLAMQHEHLQKQLEEATAKQKQLENSLTAAKMENERNLRELHMMREDSRRGAPQRQQIYEQPPVVLNGTSSYEVAGMQTALAAAKELAEHYRHEYIDMKAMYQDERLAHQSSQAAIRAVLMSITGGQPDFATVAPQPQIQRPKTVTKPELQNVPPIMATQTKQPTVRPAPERQNLQPAPMQATMTNTSEIGRTMPKPTRPAVQPALRSQRKTVDVVFPRVKEGIAQEPGTVSRNA